MFLRLMLTWLLAGGVLLAPAQTRKGPGGRPRARLDGKGGDITSAKRRVGAQAKPGQVGVKPTRAGESSAEGVKATTAPKGTGLSDSRGDDTIKPGTVPTAKVRDGTSNTVKPGTAQGAKIQDGTSNTVKPGTTPTAKIQDGTSNTVKPGAAQGTTGPPQAPR